MAGVNKAIIIGNLGSDPELKYTPSGQAVANFSVATTETYNDAQGQRQDRTEWHRIVVWGKQAEILGNFVRKGQMVGFSGRMIEERWTDRTSGEERRGWKLKANSVHLLSSKEEGSTAQPPLQQQQQQPLSATHPGSLPVQTPVGSPLGNTFDADIPF